MPRDGRKPAYDPIHHPTLVKWMARAGLTCEQIAAELGVTRKTLYNWGRRDEDLLRALKDGRNYADAVVEDCLFRRATGYDYEDRELTQSTTEEEALPVEQPGDARKVSKTTRTVRRLSHHVPPDVTACIFWLKNRQPHRFRTNPPEPPPPASKIRMRKVDRTGKPDGRAASDQ